MSHHKREDLGIRTEISTGEMFFESADPNSEWSDNSETEEAVTSGFEDQSFSENVNLEVDDTTFNVFRIHADVEFTDQFNEAVDWTLEFLRKRGWLLEATM